VILSQGAGAIDVFVTCVGAALASVTPVASSLTVGSASPYFTMATGGFQGRAIPAGTAPTARAAVSLDLANMAFTSGMVRRLVVADNDVGTAPLELFVLTDR